MSDQVKSDVIVVAREGYTVLLEIGGRTFDIDCHEAINLSSIFPADVLERCSSLSTHLRLGNLVYFKEGTKLSEDVTATVEIKPLREETAQHITSQIDQAEKDVNRTNMELKTRADITEATRKHIQKQVQESKKEILDTDQKILKKTVQTVDEAVAPIAERKHAMTPKELTMKVTMDVSTEDFAKRQKALKVEHDAADEADEARAENEINKQEIANEQNANEQG